MTLTRNNLLTIGWVLLAVAVIIGAWQAINAATEAQAQRWIGLGLSAFVCCGWPALWAYVAVRFVNRDRQSNKEL